MEYSNDIILNIFHYPSVIIVFFFFVMYISHAELSRKKSMFCTSSLPVDSIMLV